MAAISGTTAALISAGVAAAGTVASVYTSNQQSKAQRKLSAGMLSPIEAPTAPTIDQDSITKARNTRLLELTQKSGRASTFLSGAGNPGAKLGG